MESQTIAPQSDKNVEVKKDKAYWAAKDPSNFLLNMFHKNEEEVVFVSYQGLFSGKILKNDTYEVEIEGREEPIHKTEILYFYLFKYHNQISRILKNDCAVLEENLEALLEKDQRLELNKHFIHDSYQDNARVSVKMRNGDMIHGIIHRYGIFSINLALPKGIKIIVLNHGLYELKAMETEDIKIRDTF